MNNFRALRPWAAAAFVLAAASMAQAQDSQSPAPDTDERLVEQEQRIEQLEDRIQQLEAEAMSGAATESSQMSGSPPPDDESPPPGYLEGISGEVRDAHQLLTRDELTSDEFPASWPMFGTNTRMKIGGYLKADFVADFDGTLDSTQFLMRTIPVEGTPEYGGDAYVDFFGKETRFNLDVRRIVPGAVPLRGFIEGDFFSEGNQFRLRHAYITAGDFVIGQTWTTLSFMEAIPVMFDFAAGDALFGGRSNQVRYQMSLNERWNLSVAAEEMQFLGIQNANNLPGRATSQWPLLAVRANYKYDGGLVSIGSSIGQLHWDGAANGPSDSAVQLAFLVGGRHNLGERAFATYHLSYSEGAGENIMAFAGTDANAVLDANGNLETFPAFAAVFGFGYDLTSTLTTQGSYAYGVLDTPDSRASLALKRGGVAHLNLTWKPKKNGYFSTGVEIMYGKIRVQNDATGDATRLQLMAKFAF
jgi:hypothetical protein